jgi:endonuclease/exonuclease/phosphatase family metal-dependent hydrolase
LARRAGAVLGIWFALFVVWRVFFVYNWVPVPCPEPVSTPRAAAMSAAEAGLPAAGIKVLSYNIGGHSALIRGQHVAAIAGLIATERPDVVGLQEVHRGTWQARFRDQASEIARQTGMEIFYGPSFRALGGEFGNAVLVRGKVIDGEVLALPSFGEPRSLLRATVEVDGFQLNVFVTHLAAWGSLNRRMRTNQARCLVEHVRASGRPFVLCGDLNASPTAPDLEALLGSDLLRLCGLATETTHSMLGQRIDYIFSDPRFEVLEASVLRSGPSDHWPVLARLGWADGG